MSYETLSLKRLCIFKISEKPTKYALDDLPPALRKWIYITYEAIRWAKNGHIKEEGGGLLQSCGLTNKIHNRDIFCATHPPKQ
jgi:hypothetical protein